jgi:LysM repeat protein
MIFTLVMGDLFMMDQQVNQPRKQRIKDQRIRKVKKKVVAMTGAAFLTSLLVVSVYLKGNTLEVGASMERYLVQKGDTLYSLAKRFGSSVEEMKEVNQLKSDTIYTGEKLIVPVMSAPSEGSGGVGGGQGHLGNSVHIVKKGETLYSIAKLQQVHLTELIKLNHLKNAKILVGQKLILPSNSHGISMNMSNGKGKGHQQSISSKAAMGISEFYTVSSGDTLWNISKRFGVSFEALQEENQLSILEVKVGQKLFIPGKKNFASAEIVGAADSQTVEFLIHGHPVPLKVSKELAATLQKQSGQTHFITHKNGALISTLPH